MAAKNQKSSTLPPGLKYSLQQHQQPEDNEGFFSKLKKKLKLKKGKYAVDVNTGECENVASVSFKKRESTGEILDGSPWKLRDSDLDRSHRETRSQSPSKLSKQAFRTHSDRLAQQPQKPVKSKHERKLSYPESQVLALHNSGKSDLSSHSNQGSQHVSRVGNEYSKLDYEAAVLRDGERSFRIGKGSIVENNCLITDESAIDLDNVDTRTLTSETCESLEIGFDPGYEKLPNRRKTSANGAIVNVDPQKSPDWDPRYESVTDVKRKMQEQFKFPEATHGADFDPNYQSMNEAKGANHGMEIFEEPGYQSVKDIQRQTKDDTKKPAKTYNINKSIESLDEPGYESLNDVKKRISAISSATDSKEMPRSRSGSKEVMNDSALGMTSNPDNLVVNQSAVSGPRLSERRHSSSPDSQSGIKGFAETAVSLAEIAAAVTTSCRISCSSSQERLHESTAVEYSCIKKQSTNNEDHALYSSINKHKPAEPPPHSESTNDSAAECKTPTNQDSEEAGPDKVATESGAAGQSQKGPVRGEFPAVGEAYDSDTELTLDPGYAECADAIKGYIPYSIYSDGSGSKISSCTSLDLSAEDFIQEPGYAECADAIKTGAIKKISVSHEHLFDSCRDEKTKSVGGEIYANPQILFRKKSRLLEGGVDGMLDAAKKRQSHSLDDTDADYGELEPLEKKIEQPTSKPGKKSGDKSRKHGKVEPPVAPPLPARNYSLYLEGDDAEKVVNEVLDEIGGDNSANVADDAFHEPTSESVNTINNESQTSDQRSTDTHSTNTDGRHGLKESSADSAVRENDQCETKAINPTCAKDIDSCDREVTDIKAMTALQLNTNDPNEAENIDLAIKNPSHVSDGCASSCDCLHVRVTDNSGQEKILTIVEREESFKIREKRRGSRDKKNEPQSPAGACPTLNQSTPSTLQTCDNDNFNETDTKDFADKTCKDVINSDITYTDSVNTSSNLVDSVTDKVAGLAVSDSSGNVHVSKNSEGCEENIPASKLCNPSAILSEPSDSGGSESRCSEDKVSPTIEVTCPTLERTKKANAKSEETPGENDANYQENVNASPSDKRHLTYSLEGHKIALPVSRSPSDCSDRLSVGSVNAVKMKSISIDSESEFLGTEDLPRLEINESDLESPFDSSSDNSNHSADNIDLASESAIITKMTDELNCDVDALETSLNVSVKDYDDKPISDVNSPMNMLLQSDDSDTLVISNVESSNLHDDNSGAQLNDNPGPDCALSGELQDSGDIVFMRSEDPSLLTVVSADNTKKDDSDSMLIGEQPCATLQPCETEDDGLSVECNEKLEKMEQVSNVESAVCVQTIVDDDVKRIKTNEQACDQVGLCGDLPCEHIDVHHQTRSEQQLNDVEVSDDSAIENNDEDEGERSAGGRDEASMQPVSPTSPQSASEPLTYQATPPGLYEDNEPTHMSLDEVMGRSHPGFVSVFRAESPVEGSPHSSYSLYGCNNFTSPNIPDSDLTSHDSHRTPPPRPPPLASSQSGGRGGSGSSQSSASAHDTTPDDHGLPFRFAYGSGHSDEDSPPVVPPRSDTRKSSRRPVSYSQDFMESMRQLKDCGWYWGPLSWEEAELKLSNKPEGTFLVRDSSDERYILSLSFKNQGRVHHTRIEHHKGHFSFWSQPDSHGKSTIKEFIEQCVENSRNGRFLYFIRPSGPGSPPMPIHLLHPLSRFVQMRSLQHMCRFRILQLVRRDHIEQLPIPTRIKQYLKEAQYYVEYLDD